mmetsp:Transcript_15256/g.32939  ORF Transcript_15256/g.32939 Transcript_15256/m.32939 type:complete len:110 (+) Transcript_15256:996-1325(+)
MTNLALWGTHLVSKGVKLRFSRRCSITCGAAVQSMAKAKAKEPSPLRARGSGKVRLREVQDEEDSWEDGTGKTRRGYASLDKQQQERNGEKCRRGGRLTNYWGVTSSTT